MQAFRTFPFAMLLCLPACVFAQERPAPDLPEAPKNQNGASVSGTVIAPPLGGALIAHSSVLWIVSGVLPLIMALSLSRVRGPSPRGDDGAGDDEQLLAAYADPPTDTP